MKNLLRIVFCISLTLIAGCSSYDTRFAAAAKLEGPVKTMPYAGAYSGRWTSARNSAWGGKLRCILTPIHANDFRADFHATWHGLSSTHSVVLHTKPAARKEKIGFRAGERSFEGTSTLHTIIGAGTYSCKGHLHKDGSAACMDACYDATYDKGTFQLTRVPPISAGR